MEHSDVTRAGLQKGIVPKGIHSGCFLSLWLKREVVRELDGGHHCPADEKAVRPVGRGKVEGPGVPASLGKRLAVVLGTEGTEKPHSCLLLPSPGSPVATHLRI